jgi:hypothetical protein
MFLQIRRFGSKIRIPPAGGTRQRGQPTLKRREPTQPSAEIVAEAFKQLHKNLHHGLRDMTCEVNLTADLAGKPSIEVIPNSTLPSGMTEKLEGEMVVVSFAHDDPKVITLQSPASNGFYRYNYDEKEQEFIAEDKHELIGMLCRDLLWSCKGMPKF